MMTDPTLPEDGLTTDPTLPEDGLMTDPTLPEGGLSLVTEIKQLRIAMEGLEYWTHWVRKKAEVVAAHAEALAALEEGFWAQEVTFAPLTSEED